MTSLLDFGSDLCLISSSNNTVHAHQVNKQSNGENLCSSNCEVKSFVLFISQAGSINLRSKCVFLVNQVFILSCVYICSGFIHLLTYKFPCIH